MTREKKKEAGQMFCSRPLFLKVCSKKFLFCFVFNNGLETTLICHSYSLHIGYVFLGQQKELFDSLLSRVFSLHLLFFLPSLLGKVKLRCG